MNTKDKINRIVARNPELKETILSLQQENNKERLHKIVEQKKDKIIIIGKKAETYARLYELASIINNGYIFITSVTTLDLLDSYVDEDTPSLSTVVNDLVLVRDSRAYIPNKQKTNMIMQVFEQNTRCIYFYCGSYNLFLTEHQSLLEYARDNNIQVLVLKESLKDSTQGNKGDEV